MQGLHSSHQCLSNIVYNCQEHNPKLCLMGFDYQKITFCSNHSNGRCYTLTWHKAEAIFIHYFVQEQFIWNSTGKHLRKRWLYKQNLLFNIILIRCVFAFIWTQQRLRHYRLSDGFPCLHVTGTFWWISLSSCDRIVYWNKMEVLSKTHHASQCSVPVLCRNFFICMKM